MTHLDDSGVGAVLYPPEIEADYLRRGVWKPGTIAEHLHAAALQWPERPALVSESETLTFAGLDQLTDRRASGLVELGLPVGGRVLLQLHNRPSTVVAWYSLLKAGLVPVCTLPLHRHHEISEIGRQTAAIAHLVPADNPKFDLVEFARSESAGSDRERVIITCEGDRGAGTVSFDSLGSEVDPAHARRTIASIQEAMGPQSVAAYQLSGGTTGTPKVIPCLQASYWTYATEFASAREWTCETRVSYAGPIVHNAGIVIGLHGPHSVGAALVLGSPTLDSLLWTLTHGRATDAFIGPFAYDAVHDPRMGDAKSLKCALFSGTKVPEAHFSALEARGIWAGQVFGMGEGLCATTPLDYPRSARLAGVGIPISESDEIRIYYPGTEDEVPPEEVGELCARGPYTIRGYLNAPDHNRDAFTADGFYRSGDLVCERIVDGVRCLTIEGRIKDMISRGGEKISTAEVELLLMSHPEIDEAVLVPVPDDRLGERACAFLTGPAAEVSLEEVRRHLDSLGVAKYKWPEHLIWLDALPRSSQIGKIDRRVLREQATTSVATGVTPTGV
ncbi:AMP-binding protein [Rhodococcus wratislaviensis]|uniref:Putative 2,3-dihydroxybenzoate-AMP ligase n=1 Tax=Rhodococcus wratislaviensis NBRC 100605 TaxID=1219028 RepID=X0Q6V5_RHOWR|nr:AMP-binding protein [Rhodococcus wratislaviensis]GAF46436.1 putative 2,3-dihydroxybenzoate-AMP ligase [Rhodococcus wratislaviensis NBRC 100605]